MYPSHIAIRNAASIFVLVVIVAVIGFQSYRELPREASPDITVPILIVAIPFPGASPQDVESLITYKVENEFQNLKSLKSKDLGKLNVEIKKNSSKKIKKDGIF